MSNNIEKRTVKNLLDAISVTINGQKPWDIQVKNEDFYHRVLREGALGMGESYMDGWWEVDQLDVFFDKLLRAKLDAKVAIPLRFLMKQLFARIINFQTKLGARKVARHHYDLGNKLFGLMLDQQMQYSCGYWKNATTLEEAQCAKLDLICHKLQLKPGLRLLDIGCGWGGLVQFAAENYGVEAVGITISKEQHALASERCQGLPVSIRLQDYRDLDEQFDRVVSVGMFEHVGHKNYGTFMQTAHRALKDDGLFLLHTIGVNETSIIPNEWTTKYIFPNGALPTIAQIAQSFEKLFVMEDWHNFGADYDKTLMAWHESFCAHWEELKSTYDERFYRMWTYYLLTCAAGFRARTLQLWQVVLSKNGVVGGYMAPR